MLTLIILVGAATIGLLLYVIWETDHQPCIHGAQPGRCWRCRPTMRGW